MAALGTLYVVSTLPTPLYPLYERRFHFSELVVTEIYAAYLLGNLLVLLLLGKLSDQIGRRPTALGAFALVAGATLCFVAARTSAWLFVARAVSGLAIGLGASTLTAWIAELEPSRDGSRAALIAVAGNLAGLALGALGAGLLAESAPRPLRTSYLVYLAVLVCIAIAVARTSETVEHPARRVSELSLRPRIGVPKELRGRFTAPAMTAFVALSLGGFYAALTPGLVAGRLQQSSLAVSGGIVALFFGVAALTAGAVPRIEPRTSLRVAVALMFAGLALLVAADRARSLPLLLVATIACGGTLAFGFRGSLQAINAIAPADRRAELVSAYLLVCYVANALPVLGVGLLGRAVGSETAHVSFAVLLGVFGAGALVASKRFSDNG